MTAAWKEGIVIPAYNIPYLPMMESVVRALRDTGTFGLIAVSRPEWEKFEAKSPQAVYDLYREVGDERYTRIHLDHVPVIDEDLQRVDYESIIGEALRIGFESVMVDGSRLTLEENIAAAKRIVDAAHGRSIAVEAELGAVLGHEEGPLPPYEELYRSGKGFTDPEEAVVFVKETGVDWLSVAIGNIHGAISQAERDKEKVAARLNIEHLRTIGDRVQRPIVLHGGSGIQRESLREAFKNGIAKINIGTTLRQVYEEGARESVQRGQENVYSKTVWLNIEELGIEGSAAVINP